MLWEVKTQSAKICLNFNFQGWGSGVFWDVKTLSAKICLNFNFRGWGVGVVVFWEVKTQSAKICLNFNFQGGGCSQTKTQNRGVLENLVKNFWKPSLLVHHRWSLTYYVYGD